MELFREFTLVAEPWDFATQTVGRLSGKVGARDNASGICINDRADRAGFRKQ